MSKLRHIPYAVLTVGLFVAGGASAQSMSTIDAREAYQQDRIQADRRDGSLTRGETARLEQGEARIDRYQARAEANGVVTPGERQRLDGMIAHENREIYHDSHNDQRAWGGRDGGDRGRDGGDHREGWNRGNDGNHNGWDRGRDGGDHREGWNRGNDGGHNGWAHGPGGTPGSGGQPHQPGMPGGTQNAGGGQYGGGHSGWSNNGGGMQAGTQNGGGQAGRPNYGGFTQGGMQNGTPNHGTAVSQYARPNASMAPASAAAAPRQAAPIRTVSAGGGRSYGGGGRH